MTEAPPAPALDFSAFDSDIRVQDDLYRHVNGRWLATAEIAADKPVAGAFSELRDNAEAAVRDIITTIEPGTTESSTKIADLYASFMDEDRIEALGVAPVVPLLTAVDGVATPAELIRLLGRFGRQGVRGLIDIEAESDPGDPNRYVIFAGQGGLGLPDEEYYRLAEYAEIRDHYRRHVAEMLELAGQTDSAEQAERILALETAIAAHHWDKVRCRDLRQMYNLRTLADFIAGAPGLHWPELLAGGEIDETTMSELVVMQPSFFTEVAELLTDEQLPAWRSWARWRVLNSMAPYLSSRFVASNFAFHGTVLAGTPELRPRWKRGVGLVKGSLGEAVGQIYVERHFSPVAKERMDILVANLIEAYRRSIIDLDWMTAETKDEALAKLAKFRPHIGYPSKWRDYSALAISADDLVGNVMRVASFELDRSLTKIGQPIDREEWLMTPQTVNAYYHPLKNEIVFPAAILQPPFFNEHADDAVNYGGIGAVIGHEIGHGFDDQGSTCDGDGALRDWWTIKDREAFEERTAALIEQFDALEPAQTPGHPVNGRLTIGENIGDLGGLTIACLAYQIARGNEPEPERDGFSPMQRLFLSWGAVWQTKMRTEMMLQRLATDPHSPAEFRCNQIVRNLPAFYDAFTVGPDDNLWLDEDQRVENLVNLRWTVQPLTRLVEQIRAASVDSGPTVVGVNGHSSSGKTTLARRLRAALPGCDVLHTDDLAWHQGVFGWGSLLTDEVLPVVRSGAPLTYRPPQWEIRRRPGAIRLAGGLQFLILEGVGASMPSIRDQLDVIIWVETDEPTRAARNRARVAAGEDSAAGYLRWMVEENAYVVEHEPWLEADVLVNGGDSIPCDRDREIVLAGVDLKRGFGANR